MLESSSGREEKEEEEEDDDDDDDGTGEGIISRWRCRGKSEGVGRGQGVFLSFPRSFFKFPFLQLVVTDALGICFDGMMGWRCCG